MENRDRDKVSRNNAHSTDAGSINRSTEERKHDSKSNSGMEFGEKIGRSEDSGNVGNMGSTSGNSSSTGGRH
jgi:hypothetical protein